MASRRSGSATAPRTRPLRSRRLLGPQWPSGSPQPVFLGFLCGRLFWRPQEKLSHWTGRCGLLVSGGGRWEKPGGTRGGGQREEGRGRRDPRRIWQMASLLPSPKCRAGARGSAAAPLPPNSWGSAVFGAISSLTLSPGCSFTFSSSFFFFKKAHLSPLSLSLF